MLGWWSTNIGSSRLVCMGCQFNKSRSNFEVIFYSENEKWRRGQHPGPHDKSYCRTRLNSCLIHLKSCPFHIKMVLLSLKVRVRGSGCEPQLGQIYGFFGLELFHIPKRTTTIIVTNDHCSHTKTFRYQSNNFSIQGKIVAFLTFPGWDFLKKFKELEIFWNSN